MSALPTYELEMKAEEERQRLHSSVTELRARLNQKLDMRANLREHMPLAIALSALACLVVGYSFTGIFLDR